MTKKELIQIENLIRDLRMLLVFKESMDRNEPFVILPISEPISVVFDLAKKEEINLKITQLAIKLKEKIGALK